MKTNLLHEGELVTIQTHQSTSNQVPESSLSPAIKPHGTEPLLLPFFIAVMVGTIAVYLIRKVSKKTGERDINSSLAQVPCSRCHFFSNSSYLRCAVRPKAVMTSEAANCSDYIPRRK